jgi:hypothetical protein
MSRNGYSYVHGNPTNWTDPSGKIVLESVGAAILGVAAVVVVVAALVTLFQQLQQNTNNQSLVQTIQNVGSNIIQNVGSVCTDIGNGIGQLLGGITQGGSYGDAPRNEPEIGPSDVDIPPYEEGFSPAPDFTYGGGFSPAPDLSYQDGFDVTTSSGVEIVTSQLMPGFEPPPVPSNAPDVSSRAHELGQLIPVGTRSRATIAVGDARNPVNGDTYRLVSSSEQDRTASYRLPTGSLYDYEFVVPYQAGTGHAEDNIVNFVRQNQWELLEVGASREICPQCRQTILNAGGTPIDGP